MKRESFDTCEWCGEVILPGEPVSPMLVTRSDGTRITQHWECGLRSIIGSAHHILRLCSCYGGAEPHEKPGLSKRDDARWAVKVYGWVQELGEVIAREQAKKRPAHGGPEGDSR